MNISPLKAIGKKCLDCMCFQKNEVKLCPIKDCPLYPYRFGKRMRAILKKKKDQKK